MNELMLPIQDGWIPHPLAPAGQPIRRGWAIYVHRFGGRICQVPDAWLEKEHGGQRFHVRGVICNSYLRFSAKVRSPNDEWIQASRLFKVSAIDEHSLSLQPIEETDIPHLYDCDPTAHPGLRWLLAELANARRHIEQLEHLTAEALEREARRSQ